MSAVVLPALDERVRWSLRVIDTSTGGTLIVRGSGTTILIR